LTGRWIPFFERYDPNASPSLAVGRSDIVGVVGCSDAATSEHSFDGKPSQRRAVRQFRVATRDQATKRHQRLANDLVDEILPFTPRPSTKCPAGNSPNRRQQAEELFSLNLSEREI
jgi:hypothetical protein